MTEQDRPEVSWSKCRDEVDNRFSDLLDLIEALRTQINGHFDDLESLPIQDDEGILESCEQIDEVLSKFPQNLAGFRGYRLTREGWSVDEFGKDYTKKAYEALLAGIARKQIKESKYVVDADEVLEVEPPLIESPVQDFKAMAEKMVKSAFPTETNQEDADEEEN